MLRIVVFSSLFVAGCDVGEIPEVGPGSDGGADSATADGSGGNGCVAPVTPVAAAHIHAAGGTSNAGMACLNAGCHNAAGSQPFTFAGSVYTDSAAGTPKRGATIKIEFSGTTVTAVSDMDGNVYATQAITFPAKTLGTSCPTVSLMVGNIVAGGGNCNNCHNKTAGATTVPIYVMP
jgi:hypothetical protein